MHSLWMITFAFGIVAAMIAHSKGRNSLGWFLAGLFIGPFALVVAALSPVEKEGLFTTCPVCFEVIREEARTCKHCHAALEPVLS